MSLQRPLILVPARLHSTRLPKKALLELHGKPMIAQTYLNLSQPQLKTRIAGVSVLTDAQEIKKAIEDIKGHALVIKEPCASGTERVVRALSSPYITELQSQHPEWTREWVINVQGDEPHLPHEALLALINELPSWAEQGISIVTLATPISSLSPQKRADVLTRSSVVKVAVDVHKRALFFSRHPIGGGEGWVHVGVYAYHLSALNSLKAPPSPLSLAERLEQLTWLEAGVQVGVVQAPSVPAGIDTPEELEEARALRF
jgi:3-deoxy-manno-octulosonate cytidylyltransferase (CMP-KDO synthetase)